MGLAQSCKEQHLFVTTCLTTVHTMQKPAVWLLQQAVHKLIYYLKSLCICHRVIKKIFTAVSKTFVQAQFFFFILAGGYSVIKTQNGWLPVLDTCGISHFDNKFPQE